MSISGVDNNSNNISFNGHLGNLANKAKQSFYDKFANRTVGESADKFYKFAGENISSAETRLIMGATALLSQPFIDFHNHKQDEKTRVVSVCRTVAKIIAGTLTGYFIRKGSIKLIKACSKMPAPNLSKWETFLTPKNIDIKPEALAQYQNAMGTFTALLAMVYTNFAIDAPLTKYLTNKFNAKAQARLEKRNLEKSKASGGEA